MILAIGHQAALLILDNTIHTFSKKNTIGLNFFFFFSFSVIYLNISKIEDTFGGIMPNRPETFGSERHFTMYIVCQFEVRPVKVPMC